MRLSLGTRPVLPIVLAAAIVVLLIVGVVRNYSPVPFWDMWDGYVGFYLRVLNGDGLAWWDFQNEHRIVLTRVLFFADLAWAGGLGIIPLAANILLAGLAAVGLCLALRASTPEWTGRQRVAWYALIVALLAFWSQAQNFTWAFQPQFFLAFLLPLASFFFAARATTRRDIHTPLLMAGLMGILSLGSMANGVLALPLLAALAASLRLGPKRTGAIALLAVAGLATARLGYPVAASGDPSHLAWNQPVAVARYLALYMGSPLGNVLPTTRATLLLSGVAGIAMLAATLAACVHGWRTRQTEPVRMALATFSLYVCISAGVTALGRVDLGPVSALSGRYTTPVLMALAANLIVLLPRHRPPLGHWIPTILMMAMIPAQAAAWRPHPDEVQGRMLAALAVELQVNDPLVLHRIFPRERDLLTVGRAARDARLGVFAKPPLDGSDRWIGHKMASLDCPGHVTSSATLPDPSHIRVGARLGMPWEHPFPSSLVLVDGSDTIVGIAIPARPPTDMNDPTADATGYVSVAPGFDREGLRACLPPSLP